MTGGASKGERRRESIVEAAAAIVVAEGVRGVSHRAVAERARCSLSATTYYFSGLDDLLGAAGELLARRWAERAERVRDSLVAPGSTFRSPAPDVTTSAAPSTDSHASAASAASTVTAASAVTASTALSRATAPSPGPVLDALLPPVGEVRGHYEQLVTAGSAPAVAQAYQAGRRRLAAAVGDILRILGSDCPPELAIAVVDGAVVSALSEGRDVRKTAADLLRRVMSLAPPILAA
ncbi:MAG: TetR/AcrR family transcriptional regulator [Georgenia sp.]